MKRFLSAGIVLLFCCVAATAAQITVTDGYGITFTILEADLSVPQGGGSAWEFTVNNGSSAWWVSVAGFGFSPDPSSIGHFTFAGPGPGFPLGPGSAANGAWGTYYADLLAVIGASALGSLEITYDLYPGDENDYDPFSDQSIWGNTVRGDGSVTVSEATAVPEPATGVLLGVGVAWLWLNRRRR